MNWCWHKWGKWETYERTFSLFDTWTSKVLPNKYIKHYQKRTCDKCGKTQAHFIMPSLPSYDTFSSKDKTMGCEGPIPEECNPNPVGTEERMILNHFIEAWNIFARIPRQHPDEETEFRYALHNLQRIISMRILRNVFPEDWAETGGE